MKRISLVLLMILPAVLFAQKFVTRYEQSGGLENPTYFETMDWWKKLDAASDMVKMTEKGLTDADLPLHVILVSGDGDFNIASLKKKGKTIIFINNGIHPGEPEGIDATKLLVRNIVLKKYSLPANVVLAIIPVYNIGGSFNRSGNYRIDQNGPIVKGFRGNAQNLDLNRDFIKADSKNAFSFTQIFHEIDPDIFVDNHASNGADYQHVMTLLTSQHNKLGGEMGVFLHDKFEPGIYSIMKDKGYDLVPYVNHFGSTPDKGWSGFWDSPRYSTGFAALWNTFSFMPETHMLKSYKQRVEASQALMESFIEFASKNASAIVALRKTAVERNLTRSTFPVRWVADTTKYTTITYKGFEAGYKPSQVSGLSRLFYDREKPYEIRVPFYNYYKESVTVEKPVAYVIPQGWWKVIDRLKANGVKMERLQKDTILEVETYRISSYESAQRPYEGHHPNSKVVVSKKVEKQSFRKGDFYILMNQAANRFIIETLEPQADDSYFAWNFFDPILGQKEGYSGYHFEDVAAEFLAKNPSVRDALRKRVAEDSTFAKSANAQLNFVYQNSPYMEPAFLEYPVYRVVFY